ncbi:hypothetical protein ACJMK2_044012 [Sinanodonta woodiana]|uniref:Ras GTPase-activating-like protein IQGAP1 n=1 Tax=Sinanodonta woodiana TaxID=1069815 RepID=A0ABD3VZ85_SINWO
MADDEENPCPPSAGQHTGYQSNERLSAEQMDQQRKQNIAYEYLCHLEETKKWIEACINEELPPTTELEESLRNGVYLALLAHFFCPQKVSLKKVYDKEQTRYKARGLHFRHTDNINHWLTAMEEIGLPTIFYPETTDIYDKKNMPRTIYCLHALSLYLFKLGVAPQIQDLYGKVNFTEEEISAMRAELEKYGIQMPAFSKIGGILANELSVDDAALHAAIIAINEAVENGNASETMAALRNPAAMLVNLMEETTEEYQTLLHEARATKAENARNKSVDPDTTLEHDVYDEMLTQAEIQGNINKANLTQALDVLTMLLLKADKKQLLECLKSSHLGLRNVKDENVDFYMVRLQEAVEVKRINNNVEVVSLEKDEVQTAVNTGNLDADTEYQKTLSVQNINKAVGERNQELLMKQFQNPSSQLPPVYSFAAVLYMEEFHNMKAEKEDDLDYDEIFAAVKVLSAIASINNAVDTGSIHGTLSALNDPNACIPNVDDHHEDRYHKCLAAAKLKKMGETCDLLTHHEICSLVDEVNQQVHEEHERIIAIGIINEAIEKGNPDETVEALMLPSAKLHDIDEKQAYRYQVLLIRQKKAKAEKTNDESAELWLEEIQANVDRANRDAQEGLKMSVGVTLINEAVLNEDCAQLAQTLPSSDVGLTGVLQDCIPTYMEKLKDQKKASGHEGSGWMMNRNKDGSKFFYNTKTGQYAWVRGDDVVKDDSLLTKEEIQKVVSEVTASHNREVLFKANEASVIKGQALVRGFLAKKKYCRRKEYIMSQEPAVVKIQALWKAARQRKRYKQRLQYFADNNDTVIKIQAVVRMWLMRHKFLKRLKYFKDNEDAVVKIQAFVRSNKAKHDYRALMYETDPPLNVVQRFVHLLDASDTDYTEEIELQKLRQQVVKIIKSNQQLEHDLDQMDIRIGLLIKNRITLQDVVSYNKKLSKHQEAQNRRSSHIPRGLKVLTKENHDRLEAYQHLFYHLQTHSGYLAKLIFEMPQTKTTKFMESVIYSLFNYGADQREEYLLIKLFKSALEEEIDSKVEKMTDIVTGNPLVVKMIVGFNRNQYGQGALKEMLQPLISEVVADKNLKINTNPVEVYKVWVNQKESETGKTSELPYDVSPEDALKHQEVMDRIQETIVKLQLLTDRFLTIILQSLDKIPYGMRYMAKCLMGALMRKFPDALEKDVLKIVGNLLYYRYINPAIVAPDAFDIINVAADKALTSDQRRNLGSVAKILQFAAANKGFGGESSYLAQMNTYIREAHEKFKVYCLEACKVEEPEEKFNIDQYSDVTRIAKPTIYISVQEILDTHQMLVEHQDTIASDPGDPLHELLEDLGEVPDGYELLGMEAEMTGDQNMAEQLRQQLSKTEISLTLTNKFELPEDDQTDIKTQLIRTKRMVVDIIACQPGESLVEIMETPASDENEELHQALVKKRDLRDKKAAYGDGDLVRHQSILGDSRLPLHMMKSKVKKMLQTLELENIVSRKNKYQDLINMIAQDIRNQRRYRNNRKQEIMKVRSTLKGLNEKLAFYESQVDYYNQYVKTCLDNLQNKGKARKSSGKTFPSVKYSGAKMKEKGVVLEIEGLPPNQFKNVQFEIKATADPGLFEVSAKFMGVDVEKVELVFQDLLQLQYEGVAVMEMFGKTKINVNLLIFLINRKFYGGDKK